MRVTVAVLALCCSCATAPPPVMAKDIDFKAELARQGEWIVVAPYGRVWHPNASIVGEHFTPYVSGGGWVHGASGWTFDTEWPFGQFVFHYGRWFVADDLGWLWWPDQTRGTAWVEWRGGDGYTGWSPIPPPVKSARTPPPSWFYTRTKFLSGRDATVFQIKSDEVPRLAGVTVALAATGPDAKEVEALGGLDREVQLPVAPPPQPEIAPEPPPEEEPAPPPPPKKKAKGKGKKR